MCDLGKWLGGGFCVLVLQPTQQLLRPKSGGPEAKERLE
jgi:hypothetical protein